MTIVLILQLSESSRSRVSLLHSAQCNVFVFVFVYLSFFPFCFCLGRRSSLERLLSNSRVAFDHQNRHHHHQMNGLNLGQNKGPLNGVPPAKTCFGNDLGVVIPA